MQDEQIVALYWDRKEEAIRQTQQKYGAYLSKIAYNILIGRYYFVIIQDRSKHLLLRP